ncbi:hypothetical protein EAI_01573 [Harpegnathos saltator]|uniref:DUF4773 domain-containing protein n=1 Tax=Harpegnathos saltator TaxID=610380 RepID=E2BPM5_HARSA|nr:hypothetical protein EAI_01573 [Harpegnathos saltator]
MQLCNVLFLFLLSELCVNFTYQRNGLNVDVALNSDTISTRTVTNYKAFQFCVFVPGCLFSTACVNILELNQFPKSITVCLRLDIYAKKQLWQINYDCISLSTELPIVSTDITPRMTDTLNIEMPLTANGPTGGSSMTESATEMVTNQMTMEMSEASLAEIIGMTGQASGITEVSEMSSGQTEQMTID